jgi:hypothetical protein
MFETTLLQQRLPWLAAGVLQIWLMLKAELMAPAAAEGLLTEQQAAKSATAAVAAAALCKSVAALGPGLLDR